MTTIPYAPSLDISPQASAVLKRLDSKVEDLATSVRQLEAWRSVTSPQTSNRLRAAILREVMLSVYWYQSQTTEAGFHMLGRLPKDAGKILTTLLAHKADEAEHGLWALRDYLQLGGKREIADGPPSPATFAVASVWWGLAYREEPLGYLGAEYLFEYLTAILAPEVMQSLASSNAPDQGLGFIRDHAYEDEKHTQLLRAIVARAVDQHPTCQDALFRCFDYFQFVYPIPVWLEAFERATSEATT